MDQHKQNNTLDGSGDVPVKRKRGRPRKYPRPDSEDSSYTVHGYNKKQNSSGQQAPVSSGLDGVNGNQHLHRNHENESNDAIVGQAVAGVIEAVFDAGYLLNVRVGDSDTTLRGLVFKPGRYVPICPENDVAPGVQMVRRTEVPFSSGTPQFQTPLPKGRNEQHVNVNRNETHRMNGGPSVNQFPRAAIGSSATLEKNVASVSIQTTPQVTTGNVVPVLCQPVNVSNGVPVSDSALQGMMMTQVSVGSGANDAKEIPVDGNQVLTSHSETNPNMLSSSAQNEVVPQNRSSSNLLKEEAKTIVPFEQLVTEVVKRMHDTSDAMGTDDDNRKSGDKVQLKDPSDRQEDNVNDMDQPILIEPLQAVQAHPQESSLMAPKSSDSTNTGKTTELLQVLQDNQTENLASKAAGLGSGHKLDDVRNLGIELGGAETLQSAKPF